MEAADKAMEAEHLVALGVMRKLSIEGKLKAIEGYIKDWKQGNDKLLIFGIHREPLDYLADKFKSPFLSRAKNSKHKQQMVADWIKSDDQFMFANITSAGTGVDGLQYICNNMLVIELPWRPSDLEQLIGRLYRSGQKLVSNVTFMLSSQTIDEQMLEMLDEKERVTEAVNKGIDVKKNGSGIKSVMRKILKLKKK